MRTIRGERYKLIWNNYVWLPHGTAAEVTASPTWQDLRLACDEDRLSAAHARLFEVPLLRVEFCDHSRDPLELDNLAAEPALR